MPFAKTGVLSIWLRTWAMPLVTTVAALMLYLRSAAPGITWAHQGADGAELLAAAITNGVPHPPGYPLYIPLLQIWLAVTAPLLTGADLAWRGTLLSALLAAGSVGVTVVTARHLVRSWPFGWLWSALAGLAWAISPLLWMQAIITEVYALHALLLALLGWAVLVHPRRLWYVVLLTALGVAHHLTFILLLPAAYYALWAQATDRRRLWPKLAGVFVLGSGLGALFYLRIPLVAGNGPPPINWGYADNWAGFWWLVSGAAYRGYLFASPAETIFSRVAAWAYTVTMQYSPVGLAVGLVGLADWDRQAPHLRNFSLLWVVPVSVYALVYYTRDSDIYLLAVAWIMALWLAVGLAVTVAWLSRQRVRRPRWVTVTCGGIVAIGLVVLAAWRWPAVALSGDSAARAFVAQAGAVLEPGSIVVTLNDRETFALWYGVWGSGELAARVPGIIAVNDSLYQFDWYRRLQGDLYPGIAGIDQSVDALIAANQGVRPIYFAQLPAAVPPEMLEPVGPLWRLKE